MFTIIWSLFYVNLSVENTQSRERTERDGEEDRERNSGGERESEAE